MYEKISRMAEVNEVEVWHDMMAAMPPDAREALSAGSRGLGGAIVVGARTVPAVTFNRAFGIGLDGQVSRKDAQNFAAVMRETCSPVAQLQVAPLPENAGIESVLQEAGFRIAEVRWAKLGRPTSGVPKVETELTIEEVTRSTAGEFAAVVGQGFGLSAPFEHWLAELATRPGWLCLLARKDGVPAAAAAAYFGDGCAWLGMAATLPQFRRLGGQGALLARRVSEAAARGLPWAFTETGILPGRNPSLDNMRRIGFETLHERRNWVLAH